MSFYVLPNSAEIKRGMSFEEYRKIARYNQSYFKRLLKDSPAHAEHEKKNPSPPTDSMELGTLMHSVVFREINIDNGYLIHGYTKGTKDFGIASALAKQNGMGLIKDSLYEKLVGMREAVPSDVSSMFEVADKELTILFDLHVLDSELVIPCKARLDLSHEPAWIGDYKTTSKSIGEDSFSYEISTYFYDLQAAFYQLAAKAAFGNDLPFRWFVQETNAPYQMAGYDASDESLANGVSFLNDAVLKLSKCLELGQFNGVWNGQFKPIDVKDWHLFEPKLETTGLETVSEL